MLNFLLSGAILDWIHRACATTKKGEKMIFKGIAKTGIVIENFSISITALAILLNIIFSPFLVVAHAQ